MTLLEQAKKISRANHSNIATLKITKEEIELCVAWLRDEIEMSQVQRIRGKEMHDGASFYVYVCKVLKRALLDNKLSLKIE